MHGRPVKISSFPCSFREKWPNKKVLLRERKRHAARHVASARSAVLSWPGGGVPQSWTGGYPILTWRGVHHPDLAGRGYPSPVMAVGGGGGTTVLSWLWSGTPVLTWPVGYPLPAGLGYPPERTWDQCPGKEAGTGVPPGVWTDRHLWKQYLPHPSDAGGYNRLVPPPLGLAIPHWKSWIYFDSVKATTYWFSLSNPINSFILPNKSPW